MKVQKTQRRCNPFSFVRKMHFLIFAAEIFSYCYSMSFQEFCLIVIKLLRTCSTMKAAALTDKFPHICQHLRLIRNNQKKDICPLGYWNPSVDHPELLANSTVDPSKSVAELIRKEMFHYAKSNMALVNVYIKVISTKIAQNFLFLLQKLCWTCQGSNLIKLDFVYFAGPSGDENKARPKNSHYWIRG